MKFVKFVIRLCFCCNVVLKGNAKELRFASAHIADTMYVIKKPPEIWARTDEENQKVIGENGIKI